MVDVILCYVLHVLCLGESYVSQFISLVPWLANAPSSAVIVNDDEGGHGKDDGRR